MTPRQFSALTGIKHATVIEWIKAGKLIAMPVGSRFVIAMSEYRRYQSEGLLFSADEVRFARRKRANDATRKEELKRLQEETEKSRLGSADAQRQQQLQIEAEQFDESEFFDGQEDFYD